MLKGDILDINQIFRELGMLVHEQGEVIGEYYSYQLSLLILLFSPAFLF